MWLWKVARKVLFNDKILKAVKTAFFFSMNNKLYEFDQNIRKNHKLILGLDEVGRGCCAGPLVVAGVILKDNFFNENIKDSKKIKSISERKELAELIIKNSLSYKVIIVSALEVDKVGPKKASVNGMSEIANLLVNAYDICLTDYEKIELELKPQLNIVKGDDKSFSIACSSILAKSYRDDYMYQLSLKYPNYDFTNNQGYLTKKHKEYLIKYGPIENVHRFSYKPIKETILRKEKLNNE